MFDFDAGKFLIIGVVALIVIGPKELPRVLRQVGQAVSRMKRMAAEFQGQFMDAMKEADIESIRTEVKNLGSAAELNTYFDPARDIQRELTSALEEPTVAATVPAMAEIAAPTDGFVLPHPEPAESLAITADATAAATGIAPAEPAGAEELPVHPVDGSADVEAAVMLNGAAPAQTRKRKIRLPKRPAVVGRVHAVSDRTAVPRGRLVLARAEDTFSR